LFSSMERQATRPTCSSRSPTGSRAAVFASSASIGPGTAGATGSAGAPSLPLLFRRASYGERRKSWEWPGRSSRPIRSVRSRDSRSRSTIRGLALIAPVSHPWPGGVAWYYTLGAHPLFGPPFRRLLALPIGLARMTSAVASVFAPDRAPPNFIEATRLPLVLRPLHFSANCEDVACAEGAVAALSPRYHGIRVPTEVVTGDSDGVVYADIHASGLARDIPDAQLTTLEAVGHAPHHVAPERIAAVILEAERRAGQGAPAAA